MLSLSVRDIKTILQIDETEHDDYIEAMLPLVIDMVEDYCNNTFAERNSDGSLVKTKEGYRINKSGIVVPIAKIIEYYMNQSGVSQQMVSRVMVTYSDDLPKSITSVLNKYRRVKFV